MKQNDKNNNNFQDIKDDLSHATKKAGAVAQDKFNEYKEKGKEMAENIEDKAYQMGTKAREMIDDAEYRLKKGVYSLEDRIKAHPIVYVSAAMVLGGVLAKLFSSKK